MNLKNLSPGFDVGQSDLYHPIEPARTSQSIIQDVLPVCGSQHYHSLVAPKTVHLHEQLVESGVLFLIAGRLSLFANRIDLIDEDNRWGFHPCPIEQLPHFRSSHSHEDLDKLTA